MHSTELKIKLQLESDGKNSAELSKKVMEQELLMKESKRENEEEKQRMQQLHDDQVDVLQKINQQLKVWHGFAIATISHFTSIHIYLLFSKLNWTDSKRQSSNILEENDNAN